MNNGTFLQTLRWCNHRAQRTAISISMYCFHPVRVLVYRHEPRHEYWFLQSRVIEMNMCIESVLSRHWKSWQQLKHLKIALLSGLLPSITKDSGYNIRKDKKLFCAFEAM